MTDISQLYEKGETISLRNSWCTNFPDNKPDENESIITGDNEYYYCLRIIF